MNNGKFVSSELVAAAAAGPFQVSNTATYMNYFDWGWGVNNFEGGINDSYTGYRTVTTDYLVEKFGANTLIIFWDKEGEHNICLLLTGKAAPEGVVHSLASEGIYISSNGDVISGWAVEPVNTAADVGLIYYAMELNHNFDLTGKITRAEFARVAVDLYYAISGEDPLDDLDNPFEDVTEDTMFASGILAAYKLKIVTGKTTTRFAPDALVTRQEAATMLSRVYEAVGGEIPAVTATTFADDGEIAGYARNAVAFMSGHEIINGVGGNRFNPKGDASVEQALKIAVEMLDKLGK